MLPSLEPLCRLAFVVQVKLHKRWSSEKADDDGSEDGTAATADAEMIEIDESEGNEPTPAAPSVKASLLKAGSLASAKEAKPIKDVAKSGASHSTLQIQRQSSASSIGDDAASSKGQQQEPDSGSGSKTVDKWCRRINLQSILDGTKAGVDVRQGTLALEKLSTKHMVQLQAHLDLAAQAQKICMHGIKTTSTSDIFKAMDALAGLNLRFPAVVQVTLWQRDAECRLRTLLADAKKETFAEYLACVRPYLLENMTAEFDRVVPKLAAVDVSDEERESMCLHSLVTDLLLPLVLEGEGAFKKLLYICGQLSEASQLSKRS